jgi:hypothetical protein
MYREGSRTLYNWGRGVCDASRVTDRPHEAPGRRAQLALLPASAVTFGFKTGAQTVPWRRAFRPQEAHTLYSYFVLEGLRVRLRRLLISVDGRQPVTTIYGQW